jgi:hypothetical protein
MFSDDHLQHDTLAQKVHSLSASPGTALKATQNKKGNHRIQESRPTVPKNTQQILLDTMH